MARPVGSTTGKGHELALRWAQAFGTREMLSREILGEKNPFPEYKTVQEIQRRMAIVGYTLTWKFFDNKSKVYGMHPRDVEKVLNEVHAG